MDRQRIGQHGIDEYILSIMDFPDMESLVETEDKCLEEGQKLYPFLEMVYLQMAHEVKKFMDKMPGGFFIYHADGEEEIIYANQALLRIFKCETIEEFRKLTGNSFKGIVHPDDLEKVEASIQKQIAQSHYDLDYVEYRIIQKDGETRWVEDYGHFIHRESVGDIFYVFVADATEKRQKQEEEKEALLKESTERETFLRNQIKQYDKKLEIIHQEHLRRLEVIEGLSMNYESILYVDLDADEVLPYRLSSRLEREFEGKFQARGFLDFIIGYVDIWVCSEDKEAVTRAVKPPYINKKLEKDKNFYVNYRVLNREEMQYLQLRVVDVGNRVHASQIVIGCRRVDEEIKYEMEQKKVFEEALNHARLANIAKNTFLSNMSHDMRTPLNAIVGFTALARNHIEDRDKIADYLNKIEASSDQLLHLINNILEISRIESGKIQKEETVFNLFDVMQDIQKTMQPYAVAKGLSFTVDMIDFKHSTVYGDRDKLSRILLCLVSNGIKYTNNEGWVRVTAVEKKDSADHYASYQFVVEDNGIGISEEYLGRIFEPFERVQNTTLSGVYGTGLGLTIAKNFVEMMAGKIEVASSPGKGSKFTVTISLRLQEEPLVTAETAKETLLKLLNKRKILLVDDNEINLEIASELLQELNFQVDVAENGEIAVEKIKNSSPGDYAVVLMDIQMPVMDGYQASRAIRDLDNPILADIPIIALSANAFDEDQRMAWESGMNAHMAKPFHVQRLIEVLANILPPKEERSMISDMLDAYESIQSVQAASGEETDLEA